jgi:hypothetical protein
MFFEYLKLDKNDFKDFLVSKKFEIIETPILDDYFSLDNQKEKGCIISVHGVIHKLLGFVFTNFKKAQVAELITHFDRLYNMVNIDVPFDHGYATNTLAFVFKDNKVSVVIKDVLHAIIDETDMINLKMAGIHFTFKNSLKFGQFISLIEQKTEEYFKTTYNIEYTSDNLENIQKITNVRYNLNAPQYSEFINKRYNQQDVAKHMDEQYAAVMLSSVINQSKDLNLLVTEPTIDMSRKVNHNGKSYGIERVTFPVSKLIKTEKLLDFILVNEWSKKTMQMVSALILYQVAINNLLIKHLSVVMPSLLTEKKILERFELLTVVSETDTYFNNRQSFKIIFGLNIQIQVKDGTAIVYDQTSKNLDDAYVHFIEYFKKRIIKKIPDKMINNDTLKLLGMINF